MMKNILLILLLLCYTNIQGQNNISGKIIDDETNLGISWTTVILYQNTTIIKTALTNDLGEFVFENIKDGYYRLETHYIGYKKYTTDVELGNKEHKELLISLETTSTVLDEVTIVAEKTTIEHKSDRKIINLGKDLLFAGAAATDILNELPSVKVSNDGNVSLRGNQNVKILINGKSQSLPNDRLLQQIPSNAISKIEIITNPSAKYEAAGLSGIINIITKKQYNIGGKVNISSGFGTGKKARISSNIDVSYATKKIKMHANYSYNTSFWDNNAINTEERELIIFQDNQDEIYRNSLPYYIKGGIDFFKDQTNTFSIATSLSKNMFNGNANNNTTETTLLNNTTNNATFILNSESSGKNTDVNLNYRKEFNGADQYLEADANYTFSPFEFTSKRETYRDNTNDLELQSDQLTNSSNITTLSLDYYHQKTNSTLELGVRSELRNVTDNQDRFVNTQIPTNTNIHYDYSDGIYAAYGVYEKTLGNFSIKGGLRLEHTTFDLKNNNSILKNEYTNLFPSLSSSFHKNGHKFSVNYSRRISRPSIWHLSNKTFQLDQYTQFTGNPNLQPEYAHKVELNYYKKFETFNINSTVFYTGVTDVITFIQTTNATNVVRSLDNIGSSQDYGLELYSNIDFFHWWNATIHTTYYFKKFKNQSFLNTSTFSHDYYMNNTFNPFKRLSIQANIGIIPRNTDLQSTTKGFSYADMAISSYFFNKKAQIILRVNDVFNSRKNRSFGEVNGFSFDRISRSPSSRHLFVTFRYNFSFGNQNLTEQHRNRKNRNYTKRG